MDDGSAPAMGLFFLLMFLLTSKEKVDTSAVLRIHSLAKTR